MANKKNNNTYQKQVKEDNKSYSNPVKSPVGKIIVAVLAITMVGAGLISLIYAIVQYILRG